jgi:hypothetical protein
MLPHFLQFLRISADQPDEDQRATHQPESFKCSYNQLNKNLNIKNSAFSTLKQSIRNKIIAKSCFYIVNHAFKKYPADDKHVDLFLVDLQYAAHPCSAGTKWVSRPV